MLDPPLCYQPFTNWLGLYPSVLPSIGSLSNNKVTGTKTSLKKWSRAASNLMALILSLSVRQMLAVFSGVEFYFRKKNQTRCLVFTFSTKCEIRHFHVVVVQWRQTNVRDARAELLFCRSKPLTLFCRSRWRRRRHCFSSLILFFVCPSVYRFAPPSSPLPFSQTPLDTLCYWL